MQLWNELYSDTTKFYCMGWNIKWNKYTIIYQELLNNESKERCFMNTGSDRNELYTLHVFVQYSWCEHV